MADSRRQVEAHNFEVLSLLSPHRLELLNQLLERCRYNARLELLGRCLWCWVMDWYRDTDSESDDDLDTMVDMSDAIMVHAASDELAPRCEAHAADDDVEDRINNKRCSPNATNSTDT